MTKEEILEKVKQKLLDRAYRSNCLSVHICPECGGDLFVKSKCWGIWDWECKKCKTQYKRHCMEP